MTDTKIPIVFTSYKAITLCGIRSKRQNPKKEDTLKNHSRNKND